MIEHRTMEDEAYERGFNFAAELMIDQVTRLRAEVERLTAERQGWLDANSPGGWIDDLRCSVERLTAERDEARAVRDHFGERALYWSEREAKARAERDAIERATIDKCVRRLSELYEDCTRDQCAAAIRALKERQGGEK